MRMDPTRGQPASALVNRMTERELAEALLELGDETDAPQIARLIVRRRAEQPITTTDQLCAIVCEARDFTLQRAAGAKLHPAARTFQALRILVNRELANLDRLLAVLPDCLAPGGVAAIISFHSGEDRRVKAAFRDGRERGVYAEVVEGPDRRRRSRAARQPPLPLGQAAVGTPGKVMAACPPSRQPESLRPDAARGSHSFREVLWSRHDCKFDRSPRLQDRLRGVRRRPAGRC